MYATDGLRSVLKRKTLKNERRIERATEPSVGLRVASPLWAWPLGGSSRLPTTNTRRGRVEGGVAVGRGSVETVHQRGKQARHSDCCSSTTNNTTTSKKKVTLSVKEGVRFLRQGDCDALWLYLLSQRGPRPELPHISVLRRWAFCGLPFVFAVLLRQLCGALPCHLSSAAPVTCLSPRGVQDRRVGSKRHHFVARISANLVKHFLGGLLKAQSWTQQQLHSHRSDQFLLSGWEAVWSVACGLFIYTPPHKEAIVYTPLTLRGDPEHKMCPL